MRDLAEETGAHAVWAHEAGHAGPFVVVTIPEAHVPDIAGLFRDIPDDVVVADTCNHYPRHRDGSIDAIEDGMTESRWVSEQLGQPVIKAFNNIRWTSWDSIRSTREAWTTRGSSSRARPSTPPT